MRTPEVPSEPGQESGRGWGSRLQALGSVSARSHGAPSGRLGLGWGAQRGLPGASAPLTLSPLFSVPEALAQLASSCVGWNHKVTTTLASACQCGPSQLTVILSSR